MWLLSLILILGGPVLATKPASPALQGGNSLATGLSRYYLLNEGTGTSVTDYSTNAATGTLSGGASWTTDSAGNAVACTGGGNLQLPWPARGTNDDFTFLVIHKATSYPGGFTCLFDDTSRVWSVFLSTAGSLSFSGNMIIIGGHEAMTTGSLWQYLYTRDRSGSGNGTAYVNGTQTDQASGGISVASALTLHFGDNPSGGGSNYDGLYDLIAFWTRVLTPTEISAIATDPYAVVRPSAFSGWDEDSIDYLTRYNW